MRYLDANVFIRGITQDTPAMSEAALALFERIAAGQEEVGVLESTVAEVVYVLASRGLYARSRELIREQLVSLLSYRGVRMEGKERTLSALALYASASRLSYADALVAVAALSEPEAEVYSFDRDFDHLSGVTRVEP